MKSYYVYIMASKKNGVLYVGMTSDIKRRVYEHKNGLADGFTKKYFAHKLVYFESTADPNAAIAREKQLKRWRRQWKIDLIERENPEWRDIHDDL
jgi:putative endonuclease